MQQLASNNYETVNVQLRDKTIIMPADKGYMLMEYLTSDNTSSHVMITDITGVQTVVNKNDIREVSPVIKSKTMQTPTELGLDTDGREEPGPGYEKFQEMKMKMKMMRPR